MKDLYNTSACKVRKALLTQINKKSSLDELLKEIEISRKENEKYFRDTMG